MLEYFISNLEIDVFQYHLLLMGYFNARTANIPYFIRPDTVDNVPQLRDHSGILTHNNEPRTSLDNVCNKQGQLLLHFCKSYSLFIANGRVGDDKSVGNYTYISTCSTGKSTIDYVLLYENGFHCIANVYIDDRTESCQLPVVAIFYSNVECDNVKPPVKSIRNYVFNDSTITSPNDSLLSWFYNSKLKELLYVISNVSLDINCIVHD